MLKHRSEEGYKNISATLNVDKNHSGLDDYITGRNLEQHLALKLWIDQPQVFPLHRAVIKKCEKRDRV